MVYKDQIAGDVMTKSGLITRALLLSFLLVFLKGDIVSAQSCSDNDGVCPANCTPIQDSDCSINPNKICALIANAAALPVVVTTLVSPVRTISPLRPS